MVNGVKFQKANSKFQRGNSKGTKLPADKFQIPNRAVCVSVAWRHAPWHGCEAPRTFLFLIIYFLFVISLERKCVFPLREGTFSNLLKTLQLNKENKTGAPLTNDQASLSPWRGAGGEGSEVLISPTTRSATYLADLWRYRDLMWLFVKRDFAAKYKQTVLGPLWHFIQPALTTLISFLLFNVVAKISTGGMNPILFQMCGIIIWNYFAACFTSTSNTFIANAGIFGKVYFPRLVSPISVVISQLIQFGIQLLLLFVVMLIFALRGGGFPISMSWLIMFPVLLIMAGMGLGLGILVSSVTTKYRDLTVLIAFGVQLLMYLSAVNYPLSALEGLGSKYAWLPPLVKYNPLAALVEAFRNAMLGGQIPWWGLGYSAMWATAFVLLGAWMFSRVERTFMDTV
jgi:lipopolysaccharide transport system permease protein